MLKGGPDSGTSSLIGVALCIVGNTTISLGLNLQKLAHIRLQRTSNDHSESSSSPQSARARIRARTLSNGSSTTTVIGRTLHERTPLLSSESKQVSSVDSNLAESAVIHPSSATQRAKAGNSSQIGTGLQGGSILFPSESNEIAVIDEPPIRAEERKRNTSRARSKTRNSRKKVVRVDKKYLRQPLWWSGLLMLNCGELANFVAYGFAPASLVAPLGTVALVANCVIAPLLLKEPFRRQDILGCALAVIGGVTVIFGSRSNDKKLFPDELLAAISSPLFVAYAIVSLVTLVVLVRLSNTRYGERWVMVDVGICAVAGAFTVLSTKAFSSFLNLIFLETFKYWITYPVLATLLVTALIQVNFINKSLQRYDARIVIPCQFSSFSLSAIIGSAILYREFDDVEPEAFVNFLFGCLISALGVYVLTRETSIPEEPESPSSRPASLLKSQQQHTPQQPPRGRNATTPKVYGTNANNSNTQSSNITIEQQRPPMLSLRARTISVASGGGQYLLATTGGGSPRSVGREGAGLSRRISGMDNNRLEGDLEEGREESDDFEDEDQSEEEDNEGPVDDGDRTRGAK